MRQRSADFRVKKPMLHDVGGKGKKREKDRGWGLTSEKKEGVFIQRGIWLGGGNNRGGTKCVNDSH